MPQLQITNFNIVCSVFGGYFVFFNLISYLLRDHLYLSDALLAFLVGVCLGPSASSLLGRDDFGDASKVLLEFARVLLAIQLVLSGVQLPHDYIRRHFRPLGVLLVPVMASSWLVASAIIYLLVPDLPYLQSMMLGACLTPTDPILSNAIVRGSYARENVPEHIRLLLSAEAGANDGFGYPYMFLALYLADSTAGKAIWTWLVDTVLYTVCLSVVYGALAGAILRYALKYADKRTLSDKESVACYGVVLALFLLGTSGMLGLDDLLACYAAGHLFTWDDWFRTKTTADSLQSTVDFIVTNSFFLFFGLVIPFRDFNLPDLSWWRFVVIAILVFAFKRIPPLIVFYKFIPNIQSIKEALFVGHFGPVGVGAIYYAGIALEHLKSERNTDLARSDERLLEILHPIVYFCVLSSMIVHGMSVPLYRVGVNLGYIIKKELKLPDLWEKAKTKERKAPRLRQLEWSGYQHGAKHFSDIVHHDESSDSTLATSMA